MEQPVPVEYPRVPELRQQMEAQIRALSDTAAVEFFHAIDVWAATVNDGRETLGVLNRRYELCLLESESPAPWIAAAYDTQLKQLVLVAMLPERRVVKCPELAQLCARALGEEIQPPVQCYAVRRWRRG
jgi:hypothetical protein